MLTSRHSVKSKVKRLQYDHSHLDSLWDGDFWEVGVEARCVILSCFIFWSCSCILVTWLSCCVLVLCSFLAFCPVGRGSDLVGVRCACGFVPCCLGRSEWDVGLQIMWRL